MQYVKYLCLFTVIRFLLYCYILFLIGWFISFFMSFSCFLFLPLQCISSLLEIVSHLQIITLPNISCKNYGSFCKSVLPSQRFSNFSRALLVTLLQSSVYFILFYFFTVPIRPLFSTPQSSPSLIPSFISSWR